MRHRDLDLENKNIRKRINRIRDVPKKGNKTGRGIREIPTFPLTLTGSTITCKKKALRFPGHHGRQMGLTELKICNVGQTRNCKNGLTSTQKKKNTDSSYILKLCAIHTAPNCMIWISTRFQQQQSWDTGYNHARDSYTHPERKTSPNRGKNRAALFNNILKNE